MTIKSTIFILYYRWEKAGKEWYADGCNYPDMASAKAGAQQLIDNENKFPVTTDTANADRLVIKIVGYEINNQIETMFSELR